MFMELHLPFTPTSIVYVLLVYFHACPPLYIFILCLFLLLLILFWLKWLRFGPQILGYRTNMFITHRQLHPLLRDLDPLYPTSTHLTQKCYACGRPLDLFRLPADHCHTRNLCSLCICYKKSTTLFKSYQTKVFGPFAHGGSVCRSLLPPPTKGPALWRLPKGSSLHS